MRSDNSIRLFMNVSSRGDASAVRLRATHCHSERSLRRKPFHRVPALKRWNLRMVAATRNCSHAAFNQWDR
jgi:hypothetical protein